MKNATLMLSLSVAMLAGFATDSMAAGDRQAGRAMNFAEVDANADGLISPEEVQDHRTARFASADTDGNGELSRAEIEERANAGQSERRAKFIDRMFERRDANADGVLSLDEMVSSAPSRLFERADADGDGLLSKAEFDAAKEARRAGKNKAQ